MSDFKEQDEAAYFLMETLIDEAIELGLPFEGNASVDPLGDQTYRAPVGKALPGAMKPESRTPWMGEIRVEGTQENAAIRQDWRYYFIEPRSHEKVTEDLVLGCFTGSKGVAENYDSDAQTRQMRVAVDAGKRWCTRHSDRLSWRMLL